MTAVDIRIVEVGPRDGLQNESQPLSVEQKVHLINRLSEAGLSHIEAGSFVSPKWVPQMANSDQVLATIKRLPGIRYAALTPNFQGFENAVAAGADEVAVFTAASESFTQRNINCSIEESLSRFMPIMEAARGLNLPVRGYVSCVLGCPYEGKISPQQVLKVSHRLLELGCYEVSLGDTIGIGTSLQTRQLLRIVLGEIQAGKLAVHFHDTYGQALANIATAIEMGITTLDASVSGLGGCPYAKGASGNVATEDVVYMLEGNGLSTGIRLSELVTIGQEISDTLNRPNGSKAGRAILGL